MDVTTATTVIDISTVDFNIIMNEMVALVPALLPVSVTCLGIRKGISFILSMLRGA